MLGDLVIDRRALLISLAAPFVAPVGAVGQSRERVFRIGFLRSGQPPKAWVDAFHTSLRELGYVEGRNVVVEYRVTDGTFDPLPRLAEELVRLKVDVLVASAAPAALAAQKVTATLPIVFVVPDPVAIGLVPNLSRPSGNATGLAAISTPELTGKRLELLRDLVPNLTRVAVLWHPENPTNHVQLKGAQAAAAAMNVQLQASPISGPADFESAFRMARGAGGLLLLDDALFTTHRRPLADLSLRHRLIAMYCLREFVDVGGLMSYGPSFSDLYRRAAIYVDKILTGAKPGDLPIEQASLFELIVNLKTAKSARRDDSANAAAAGGSNHRVTRHVRVSAMRVQRITTR